MAQVAPTTEPMLFKELSELVEVSLDGILQCTYEKESTGVRSVVHKVVQKILFDLLH